MATLSDDEFGIITLRRSTKASVVKIRVGTDGLLHASLPLRSSASLVTRLIESSRPELRAMLLDQRSKTVYVDGMQIGKSHRLTCRPGTYQQATVTRHGQQLIINLPAGTSVEDQSVQAVIRSSVIDALRREAKSYLPKRLAYLATQSGFTYQKVRFSHASGRWGSCTSSGTISLNIALMKLPFYLIDYVLFHELSHTIEMNHSPAFWRQVARCDPAYAAHRRELKAEMPSI